VNAEAGLRWPRQKTSDSPEAKRMRCRVDPRSPHGSSHASWFQSREGRWSLLSRRRADRLNEPTGIGERVESAIVSLAPAAFKVVRVLSADLRVHRAIQDDGPADPGTRPDRRAHGHTLWADKDGCRPSFATTDGPFRCARATARSARRTSRSWRRSPACLASVGSRQTVSWSVHGLMADPTSASCAGSSPSPSIDVSPSCPLVGVG
jgi:hypothetical protein